MYRHSFAFLPQRSHPLGAAYPNPLPRRKSTTYDRPSCLDELADRARIAAEAAAAAHADALKRTKSGLRAAAVAALRRKTPGGAVSHERRDAAAQDALSAGALDEAIAVLRDAGLESSQLAVFVDLTSNNKTRGARSFEGRNLHDVADPRRPNPYQQVIAVLGRTLAPFDSDGLVPLYGFGDSHSVGKSVLPLHFGASIGAPDSDLPEQFCKGFAHLMAVYTRRLASGSIKLSGPTNFAPAIRKTIELSTASGARELTICLILTCSQSESRIATEAALKDASKLPIAIVVVGVGDGPFTDMARLDDNVGSRLFDNLVFVELEKVRADCAKTGASLATALALACLSEIPEVIVACEKLGYFGSKKSSTAAAPAPKHASVSAPSRGAGSDVHGPKAPHTTSRKK
jgi:hypothetical protein